MVILFVFVAALIVLTTCWTYQQMAFYLKVRNLSA